MAIKLGKVVGGNTHREWIIPLGELSGSTLVLGKSSAGRTKLIRNLLEKLGQCEVPYLIFDLNNRYLGIYEEDSFLLRPGYNFFIDIFDANGCDPEKYCAFLFDLLLSLFPPKSFTPTMMELLLSALEVMCMGERRHDWGEFLRVINEESETVPLRYRKEAKDGLLECLSEVFNGGLGQVLQGPPTNIYHLFNSNVIIDLGYFRDELGGSPQTLRFLTQFILQIQVYDALTKRCPRIGDVRHVCLLDEIAACFKGDFLHILVQVYQKIRQGVVFSNESLEGMNLEFFRYPQNLVCFHPPENVMNSRLRTVFKERSSFFKRGKILHNLVDGHAVVRNAQTSVEFIVQVEDPPLRREISIDRALEITAKNFKKGGLLGGECN